MGILKSTAKLAGKTVVGAAKVVTGVVIPPVGAAMTAGAVYNGAKKTAANLRRGKVVAATATVVGTAASVVVTNALGSSDS